MTCAPTWCALSRPIPTSGFGTTLPSNSTSCATIHLKSHTNHPLPTTLHAAVHDAGLESEVFGWNVSCDARLYARVGGLPVVVFGPGDLATAHGPHEHFAVADMIDAACALTQFVQDWCGVR